MKTKLFFIAAIAATLFSSIQKATAQWQLTGNSNAITSSKLGTLNGVSLALWTNNKERMRIDTTGNIGIGTTIPPYPLTFAASLGDKISLYGIYGVNRNHYGFGIQNHLLQIHTDVNASDIAFGYGFSSSFNETMRIKGNGNVYMGTANPWLSPGANARIFEVTATQFPQYLLQATNTTIDNKVWRMIARNSNIFQIQALSDSFGNEQTAMQINRNGNSISTVSFPNGNIGIGTTTPQYPLDVTTANSLNAVRSVNTVASGNGIFSEADNGVVPYGVEGVSANTTSGFAGYFSGNLHYTGVLTGPSDLRLKEDIKPIDKVLDKIMLLKPSSYKFKNEYQKMNLPQGQQLGFIAQDMEKVFPELVKTIGDKQVDSGKVFEYKGINYIGLIPLLTKAIQDQQEEISELKNEVSKLSGNSTVNEKAVPEKATSLNAAKLDQNIPNPFTNTSIINYYIPSGFRTAQLMITDISGRVLKMYLITQSGYGKQIISESELASGLYQYSLMIDGKVIDTKKMMLTK